jgi:hypothetical protein
VLHSLTDAAPAAAVLAVLEPAGSPGEGDPQQSPVWSVAGGLGLREAAIVAAQQAVGAAQVRRFESKPVDLGDPLFPDFDPRTSLKRASGEAHHLDSDCTIDDLISVLADQGITVLFTETTTTDLRTVGAIRTGTILLWHAPPQ